MNGGRAYYLVSPPEKNLVLVVKNYTKKISKFLSSPVLLDFLILFH